MRAFLSGLEEAIEETTDLNRISAVPNQAVFQAVLSRHQFSFPPTLPIPIKFHFSFCFLPLFRPFELVLTGDSSPPIHSPGAARIDTIFIDDGVGGGALTMPMAT